MMKSLIVLIIALATAVAGMAQETWQNYYRDAQIEINFKYVECRDAANGISKSIVLLQFVNLTGKNLKVSYTKEAWYGSTCYGCDVKPEYQYQVKLTPNQAVEGNCEDKRNKALYIFDKMLDVKSSTLTKFDLRDIKIQTAE